MKEAAGEANMTVITIVLIGVVAAVGALLVPRILNGSARKAACGEMGGNLNGSTCTYKDFSTDASGVDKTCIVTKCGSGTAQAGNYVCGDGTSGTTAADLCKKS